MRVFHQILSKSIQVNSFFKKVLFVRCDDNIFVIDFILLNSTFHSVGNFSW